MKKSNKYELLLKELVTLIDIAEDVVTKSTTFDPLLSKPLLNYGEEMKHLILNPDPKHANLKSLRFVENDFLIFWNESKGAEIEDFWKKVYKANLSFRRKDVINKVLKRGRIKNIHEYNNIVDNIVAANQIGKINESEMKLLSNYIGEFEHQTAKDSDI